MNHIEAQIMGQSYRLVCPENGEAQLLAAVEKVNQAMCGIRDAGKIKARDKIAVLAALNLAFDLCRALSENEQPTDAPASVSDASSTVIPMGLDMHDPRLTQLMVKLDQVLAQDGHLL